MSEMLIAISFHIFTCVHTKKSCCPTCHKISFSSKVLHAQKNVFVARRNNICSTNLPSIKFLFNFLIAKELPSDFFIKGTALR